MIDVPSVDTAMPILERPWKNVRSFSGLIFGRRVVTASSSTEETIPKQNGLRSAFQTRQIAFWECTSGA